MNKPIDKRIKNKNTVDINKTKHSGTTKNIKVKI